MRIGIHSGIPRSAHKANAGVFSPLELGEVKSWMKGEVGTYEGDVVTNLTDLGTIGGTFDAATNAHPVTTLVGGKRAPIFRGTRRTQSSAAASEFTLLHDATSSASLCIRGYGYEIASGSMLIVNTNNAGGTRVGFVVQITTAGLVRILIGNGTSNSIVVTSVATITANSFFTITVRKVAATYYISVNGEAEQSGTATGSVATAPQYSMHLGGTNAGGNTLKGIICEAVLHSVDIGTAGAAQMRDYLSARWNATPDFSFLEYGDVAIYLDAALGITLNGSDVSAWADQSGYNNHVTQVTAANQPPTVSSWRNSHPAIDFSTSEYLEGGTFTQGALAQPNTVYTVSEWNTVGNTVYDSAATGRHVIFNSAGNLAFFAGATLAPGGEPANGAPFITRALYNGASSDVQVTENGATASSATGNAGTESFAAPLLNKALGSSNSGQGAPFAQFVVYAEDVGATADTAIHAHLETKYDITPL